MDLSILIVNWNSTAFAAKCIGSLLRTIEHLEFEVIVVDNASPDGASQTLEELSPRVRVIPAGENLGFSRANNIGAARSSGSVLFFLNPDTEVYAGAVETMYTTLTGTAAAGIVSCRLLNSDLSVQTSCIQRFPTLWNQIGDVERLRIMFPRWSGIAPLIGAPVASTAVQAVSGACLMMRREVFEASGGFSPAYFMYAEDIDLCYRVKQAGFEIVHAGTATVLHHGGQSSQTGFSAVLTRESMYKFMRVHQGPLYAKGYRLSVALAAGVRLAILSVAGLVLPERTSLQAAKKKWWKILRWSLGLEEWAERAGADATHRALVTN